MDELVNLLLNHGVAVFISVYLVYFITRKLNSKLDKLTESIMQLNNNIDRLLDEVRKKHN